MHLHVSLRPLFAPLLAVALIATVAPADAPVDGVLLHVAVDGPGDVVRLRDLGFDIAGIDRKAGVVDVVGTIEDAGRLAEVGFDVEVGEPLTSDAGTISALSDYWSPAEVEAQVDAWVATYPEIVRKVQYATTEQGRPVWAVKVSDNVAVEENESVFMMVAQHHAREVMTPEIAMDALASLIEGYGTDPQATAWVDDLEIWVLPNHNPDGADYVFDVNSNWRKNRRDNGGGIFGVDLNRNYPFRWGACNGSDGSTSSETYRGPSPASEPETFQGILELAREHRPTINLSYHTYSELVIMPYGCDGSYPPELAVFRDLSSGMATKLVSDNGNYWYEPGTGWEILYPVDGEMNDWFYAELGSYGVTVEANASSQGFRPDYATWRDSTVARNRPGWSYLLDRLQGPGVAGNVTDACTGTPLSATTLLDELVFSDGETPRTSEPLHGRYHWLALPGDHTLRVEADGYHGQVRDVEVGFDRATQDVGLVPLGSHGVAVVETIVSDGESDADGSADPGEEFDLVLRVRNVGEAVTGLTATLSSADPDVVVVDGVSAYGDLAAGASADGDGFRIRIGANAEDGAVLSLDVSFSADVALCSDTVAVPLRVTTGVAACPSIAEPFDVDPGWTISNQGTGGWAFGPPAGNGGSTGPLSAVTGENVYGTNLSGSYGNSGEFWLTTGPFDLRGLRSAELQFWRWLDNEAGFDIARTEISVDGGQTWTGLWDAFGYGDGWELQRLDISALADREEDVRFRFRLSSDANTVGSGFYLDDVRVCGEEVPNAAGKLKYLEHTLDDAGADYGNGNGVLDAGETATLRVKLRSNRDAPSQAVEAFLTTTTPGVTVRNGWAAFEDVPAGGSGWSTAPDFTVTVAPDACASRIQFRLEVRWDGGSTAESTFAVPVGSPVTATVFQDDCETDPGWTVGSNAAAGDWVLDDPYAVADGQGVAVQPEDDATPAGTLAWITANPRPKGNFDPGDGDVDAGTVWLESPPFDGTDAERMDLTYSRWFVRRNPGQFDASVFRVLASSGDGPFVEVATLEADSPAWATATHDLLSVVPPSPTMRVRIEVTEDAGFGDTLVEGLVDDFRVERERLECAPYVEPTRLPPNGVGDTLRVDLDGTHVRLEWQAPAIDAGHDAASYYRVDRSGAPDAGFAETASPTATFAVLQDEALDPSTAYFLVVAGNPGGTSGAP